MTQDPQKRIRAIPMEYKGVRFRSTLEAGWAYNLDIHHIVWSYEPWAVQIGPAGIRYLADFYLPVHRTWLEVKGPHNDRINKPRLLAKYLHSDPFDSRAPLVVIGRVPIRGRLTFHGTSSAQRIVLAECSACGGYGFTDLEGTWACRRCHDPGPPQDDHRSGDLYWEQVPRTTP